MHAKSDQIRQFIIDHVEEHPAGIARVTAEHFSITRQAVNRHLKILIEDQILLATGKTQNRSYALKVRENHWLLSLAENSSEDLIWHELIEPSMGEYPDNVQRICHYGFTEIYNNAVDHSGGTEILVSIEQSVRRVKLTIVDDGIGIFEKIKSQFKLIDHRAAILELSKGKLTTDPGRHTGQGIFFTSRMFDDFSISANHLYFSHGHDRDDWLIEVETQNDHGTIVQMTLSPTTTTTSLEVFDRYSHRDENDEFPFSKTHVPLSLARYDREQLVSRSQAKRVLARFERFEEIALDFAGINMIGQAFADEIFRVFRNNHPDIKLVAINANDDVMRMIRRAQAPSSRPSSPDDPT